MMTDEWDDKRQTKRKIICDMKWWNAERPEWTYKAATFLEIIRPKDEL